MFKPLIFCRGQTKYENLGDLLIARTLLAILREHGRIVVDDHGVPVWYRKEIGLQDNECSSCSTLPFFAQLFLHGIWALISQRSTVYLVLPSTHSHSRSLQRDVQLMLAPPLMMLLRFLGVRICRVGVSIGPFTFLRSIIEALCARQMHYHSFRESSSMMYARKIGVQRIDFFPDMIWLLPVPILSDALPGSARKEAVLSFRHDVRTDCKPEGYVSCLLTILDQLVDYLIRDAGFTVRIAYQVDEDQSFSLFLWERYRNQYEFLSSPEPITQKTIGEVYSAAGLVFSNRLHVLLLGVLHGCIPFAVIDADEQQKISGMFNDMLLNHLIVDVRHDTFNGEYIQDVLRDYAILQERISKYAILCRRKARSVLQHLFERSD